MNCKFPCAVFKTFHERDSPLTFIIFFSFGPKTTRLGSYVSTLAHQITSESELAEVDYIHNSVNSFGFFFTYLCHKKW